MGKYIVAGLGVFGYRVAIRLAEQGQEVIGIDSDMDIIENIQDNITQALCMDSTDERALMSLGLDTFNVGVVGIGENFEANLLTAVLMKNGGVQRVVSRAVHPIHIRILKTVGIDDIITPGIDSAEKLVSGFLHHSLLEIIHIDKKTSVAKIIAPLSFVGKTIGKLNLRAQYGVNVISVNRGPHDENDEAEISNPGAETMIEKDDVLLVIGDSSRLERMTKGGSW